MMRQRDKDTQSAESGKQEERTVKNVPEKERERKIHYHNDNKVKPAPGIREVSFKAVSKPLE